MSSLKKVVVMTREKFEFVYQRAAERKGGVESLESIINKPLTAAELASVSDDRWLACFTEKVFQCGISWSVVRKKWPNFEQIFFGFDIEKMLLMPDAMWEKKAQDPQIIRHLTKVMTIPANARMIQQAQKTHGSFATMIADWPTDDITGLWNYLKKHGKRLGGNTGAYSLRVMGKDTFILSSDVEAYLRQSGIVDSGRTTKRAQLSAQTAFNDWQQESGRSLSEISQVIAFSCGDNRV